LGGVSFCGVSQDVRDCLKNRLIRLCHVPGVGLPMPSWPKLDRTRIDLLHDRRRAALSGAWF
jgi:hypothetical protein